jgi:serine/threonine protein kinase
VALGLRVQCRTRANNHPCEGLQRERLGAVFRGGEKVSTVEVPGYEITEVVSSGANGIVFSAVHRQLDRDVVIKVYPPRLDRNGIHPYEQARSEAVKVEALKHDRLATLYDFGQLDEFDGIPGLSEGWPYCVMEYRAGTCTASILGAGW